MDEATLLPAIGLGTAPLAGFRVPVSEEDAAAAVEAALEVGYRYFDTAPLYGYGLAERRLGRALKGCAEDVRVSTKVGRLIDPDAPRPAGDLFAGDRGAATFDFSADGVRRSLEASFERMDRTYVDAAFIHDPDQHARQAFTEAYPALEQLRGEGAVGAIGVGMNRSGLPTRFVTETDIDVVLIAGRYTLLDRQAEEELFGAAVARGVHLVVGGVYNSGVLAGRRDLQLRARLAGDSRADPAAGGSVCEHFRGAASGRGGAVRCPPRGRRHGPDRRRRRPGGLSRTGSISTARFPTGCGRLWRPLPAAERSSPGAPARGSKRVAAG